MMKRLTKWERARDFLAEFVADGKTEGLVLTPDGIDLSRDGSPKMLRKATLVHMCCPHTVQSDTTRCGDSRVGHPGRAKHHLSVLLRFQPIDSTSQ
jgi:hypothetical protein